MGRRNERGLELSFKPARGRRGRGRWFKKIQGREQYFGWGDGYTDRAGYQQALNAYRAWLSAGEAERNRRSRTALTRQLQHAFSYRSDDSPEPDLDAVRRQIEALRALGGTLPSAEFQDLADRSERRRLLASLGERSLDELRRAFGSPPAAEFGAGGAAAAADPSQPIPAKRTADKVLEQFVDAQRTRLQRRQHLDALRAAGKPVNEPAKQNIAEGRFAAILRDVAAMKRSVGRETWDGSEATAARIIRKFRDESEALVLTGAHSPHTFNERVKLIRMFCAWADANYQLDRLPRDRTLFTKYSAGASTAKAIPLETLRKIWQASDDRRRCWLLLGLNCGFYAKDISDLRVGMFDGTHLRHERAKTGVRVRYKLWPITRRYLRKFLPKRGVGGSADRVFLSERGAPLVHHAKLKKSGEPVRVDNVRNWFKRLCDDQAIEGYSFSNVRDTASTEVEKIDRVLTDTFIAHKDRRMAALYVDGEMVDTGPLDRVLDQLEKRLDIWSNKGKRRRGSRAGVAVAAARGA